MARRVRLDSDGIGAVLRSSEVSGMVRVLGERVAAAARAEDSVSRHGAEVVVAEYTAQGGRLRSPRPAVAVTVKHPGGLGMEAKYGVLSRAAASAGLRMRGRRG